MSRRHSVLAQPSLPLDEIRRRLEAEALPRNVGVLLDEAAEAAPDRTVLHFIETGHTFTSGALRALVNRLANGLRAAGVRRGTHVAIMLPNAPEWPITWLALGRLGAVAVPVNTRYTARELHYALDDGAAEALVIHESHLGLLADVPAPLPGISGRVIVVGEASGGHRRWRDLIDSSGPELSLDHEPGTDDLLNIQYTSGTTGFPKGCLLTHRYWLQCAKTHAGCDGRTYTRMLAPTPFFYMTPQWLTLMALFTRGTPYVAARQSAPRFIDWLHRFQIDFCLFPAAAYQQPPRAIDRAHALVRVRT